MIVSRGQKKDSIVHVYVCIFPQTPFPSRQTRNIEQSSLCRTVGPCWLSILHIAVCVCACNRNRCCCIFTGKHPWPPLLCWHVCTPYQVVLFKKLFFYLAVLGLSCSMWSLVPWAGIEPRPPALGTQSLSHWTPREVLRVVLIKALLLFSFSPYLISWFPRKHICCCKC